MPVYRVTALSEASTMQSYSAQRAAAVVATKAVEYVRTWVVEFIAATAAAPLATLGQPTVASRCLIHTPTDATREVMYSPFAPHPV